MGRHVFEPRSESPPGMGGARSDLGPSDDQIARRYLRNLVGAALGSDSLAETETDFIAKGHRWSQMAGVDRRALLGLGVSAAVLDKAGIRHEDARGRLRRFWRPQPFSASELARWADCSEETARRAIAADLRAGRLQVVKASGRAKMYAPAGNAK